MAEVFMGNMWHTVYPQHIDLERLGGCSFQKWKQITPSTGFSLDIAPFWICVPVFAGLFPLSVSPHWALLHQAR